MTAIAGFTQTLARFGAGTPVVLCHDDAGGLSADVLLARALARTHHGPARVRVIGRGESAWSDAVRDELTSGPPVVGLIVTDLGVQAEPVLPGAPTILVDHHVPRSEPSAEVATIISGYGAEPTPTSSLLAQACAAALVGEAEAEALVWLASLGAVADLGERGAVPRRDGGCAAIRNPQGPARGREPRQRPAPRQPRRCRAGPAPAAGAGPNFRRSASRGGSHVPRPCP